MGLIQEFVGFEDSPDLETKVNTIIDFWSNPCDAPYTVYIETLYPALGRMFLALVDTSLLDIARGYLRPREGLTRGHNRKKGRRRGKIRGIPDTADMFARLLPQAQIYEGSGYGANTKFFWQIDGIIQRGLWYVVVFDATTDGLYYWAQGIREQRFCEPTNKPGLYAHDPQVLEGAFFGIWFPMVGWTTHWEAPGYDFSLGVLETPPGWHTASYFASYVNAGPAFGNVQVRLRGTGPDGQGNVIIAPGQEGQLTFSVTFKGGSRLWLETRTTGTPFVEPGPGNFVVRPV